MAVTIITLPLCAKCQVVPVKLRCHKFCSRACFFAFQDKRVERSCEECGTTFKVHAYRKAIYRSGTYCSKRCFGIAASRKRGAATNGWKGGRINRHGYIFVLTTHGEPGKRPTYIAEHRLVMEHMLGRKLKQAEIVHHKNAVKHDNRPENLELVGNPHLGQIICPRCEYHFKIK